MQGMEAQETWKQGNILSEDANTEIAGNMFPFLLRLSWWCSFFDSGFDLCRAAAVCISHERSDGFWFTQCVQIESKAKRCEKQSRASLHALNLSLPQLSHLDQLRNT